MRKLTKLVRIGDDTYERLRNTAKGFATPDATINDILNQLKVTPIEKDDIPEGENDEE